MPTFKVTAMLSSDSEGNIKLILDEKISLTVAEEINRLVGKQVKVLIKYE